MPLGSPGMFHESRLAGSLVASPVCLLALPGAVLRWSALVTANGLSTYWDKLTATTGAAGIFLTLCDLAIDSMLVGAERWIEEA